jgi:hypothetical protein
MVSNVRASTGIGVGVLIALTLSALLLLLMSSAPAQAQTSEQCQAEINDLRVATEAAESSFTNDKDQASLLGKVESASTKLSRGKTADALINLNSFLTKVNTLSAEGKLAEGAASEALTVEGTQARDCVAGLLQEQAPTATA